MSISGSRNSTSRDLSRNIRFLVADSDRRVCRGLRNIIRLTAETWCVQTARFGREALQSIRTWHVDIAIVNIDMPDLNGLEILQTVRRESPRTNVIILIDTDSTRTAVGAMKAGARDVLIKPVDEDELFASIHESLERRYPPRGDIVNRVDAYLKDHFSDYTLRRVDLCWKFDLSPTYVSRLFRDRLGTTFRDCLRYHRIEEAKRMLRFTGDLMYVIAAHCGFKNQSRFSETFRRHEGMTPGEFREIARGHPRRLKVRLHQELR